MTLWFKVTCPDCGKDFLLPFKPRPDRPKVYCHDCRYKHLPYLGSEKTQESYESVRWGINKVILDGALRNPNSQANTMHTHQWHYERSKSKHYNEAYVSGLIGEIEGRKWLQGQGYQVYEFGMMFHGYFGGLDNNISEILRAKESMKRRRKPEYAEADRQLIEDLKQGIILMVSFLKEKFGQDYLATRRCFATVKRVTKQNKVGERYPDFIVVKDGHCSIVEVKTNHSKFYAGQVGCFEIAGSYDLASYVLMVNVAENKVTNIQLSDYKNQLSKLGINYQRV